MFLLIILASQTFYPNCPIFYTDISAISVTFSNSAPAVRKYREIRSRILKRWLEQIISHTHNVNPKKLLPFPHTINIGILW